MKIGTRVGIKNQIDKDPKRLPRFNPSALDYHFAQASSIRGLAGIIDDDDQSRGNGMVRVNLAPYGNWTASGHSYCWCDPAWLIDLDSLGTGRMTVLPSEPELVEVREFDGFCDPCGGFRKHRLGCPVRSR